MALWTGFMRSAERFPERPAVFVEGRTISYHELRELATRIAAIIQAYPEFSKVPLTAVFGYRSPTAFAGILGALLAGNGYVPLNRTFPIERTELMFERSECRSIIVDTGSLPQLDKLLNRAQQALLVILPDSLEIHEYREQWPLHTFLDLRDLSSATSWRRPAETEDAIAYLLFTSGSTGIPKGVMVAHRNVRHYIDFMTERFAIQPEDRSSQTFDMTFDLSVSDMFVSWERGACVCCPSEKTLINPGRFINDAGLTIWFSVPSMAVFMKRLGTLKPGAYPSLRVSMFCGEALPIEVAKGWADAAPNSIIENIYGPTELTIACTYYRWDSAQSALEAEHGVVPIGQPFPGMVSLIVDESLTEVKPGEAGELLITGPQLSLGYWRDLAKTAAAFVQLPGRRGIYYRTGDRVRRAIGNGHILYLGRMDNQIKILGYRVELGEVEAVVREESGVDGVVALGWPPTPGGAGGVEAFLQTEGPICQDLKDKVAKRLPAYMLPRRYHCLVQFPLNANGKYDRVALRKVLETSS